MQKKESITDTGRIILDGLKGIDRYLAMMNSRLGTLLMADLPDYVMADLATIYHAEQEASQILRGLNIYCHKQF